MAVILDFQSEKFYLFLICKSPLYFLPYFESIGLSVQKTKGKIDFQDGRRGRHLGFPIGTILAIFDLQIIMTLPIKFRVNWPFDSEDEGQNRFSRWAPWRPSWITDRNDFSFFFFFTYKLPRYFLPCFETIGLSVQEKKRPGTILAVFDLQGPDTSYQFSSQLAFCFR